MNEFEFRPDRTTDYWVSCPWASKKYPYRPYNGENGVSTFSLLFLIGSFWYFRVTRTSIKAWMSLNFLKWDLTLAHWTQVSDRCPLGYLSLMHQSFVTPVPSTYGDGWGITGLMSGAVIFWVPSQCWACDITQIYPSEIYYYKELIYDSQQVHAVQGF